MFRGYEPDKLTSTTTGLMLMVDLPEKVGWVRMNHVLNNESLR